MNPWGLTDRERDCVEALSRLGCKKLAARALDMSYHTLTAHMMSVRKKSGERFTHQMLLAWERLKHVDRRVSLANAIPLWALMRQTAQDHRPPAPAATRAQDLDPEYREAIRRLASQPAKAGKGEETTD